jgi:hypothetical protein
MIKRKIIKFLIIYDKIIYKISKYVLYTILFLTNLIVGIASPLFWDVSLEDSSGKTTPVTIVFEIICIIYNGLDVLFEWAFSKITNSEIERNDFLFYCFLFLNVVLVTILQISICKYIRHKLINKNSRSNH